LKTIVYTLSNDYFFFHFKPIYDILKKNKRLRFFFVYPNGNFALKDFLSKSVGEELVIPSTDLEIIPDMIISAEMHRTINYDHLNAKKVQIYHGMGIYNFNSVLDNLIKYHVHCFVGPHWDVFLKKIKEKQPKTKVYNAGFPRTDELFNYYCKEKNKKRIIVYSAHWNEHSSINNFGCDIINSMCSIPNSEIWVRPHNHLFLRSGEYWKKNFFFLEKLHSNLKIIYEPNNCEFYKRADVVVTDIGSTASIEASCLGIPVVIFNNQEWLFENKETVIEEKMLEVCMKFETIEELLVILKSKIPNNQGRKQKIMAKKSLYNYGRAAKRVANIIIKELDIKKSKLFWVSLACFINSLIDNLSCII